MLLFFAVFFLLPFFFSSPFLSARRTPIFYDHPKPPMISNNHNYTWKEFERFLGASRGSHIRGMSELKKYFNHFGYLKAEYKNFTDLFDSNFENSLIRYQAKLGLSVTRKLDSETLLQIMSPRCGVQDTPKKLHTKRNYAFFTGQPRWARSIPITLTYAYSPENSIAHLTNSDIRDAFKRAFGHWASVIPVTFIETEDSGFADIKIGFYSGDHGDGEPFDGVLGILAHAFSPESGRFHLDAAEKWTVDFQIEKSHVAVDLESVATHEIGHLLGLAHSSVKDSVMYPSLKPREKKVELKTDDIKGIQALYGSNPNFTIEALSESDISSNDAVHARMNWLPKWSILLLALITFFCV